ncbi:MAG: hypothetical protein WBH71_08290 [Bacteroidales bacterium]|nr:hypothetical protein [Bacteroidales bacterium]MDI9593248.1 hypothetical protein [Bacteroidota bacterium]
MLEVRYLTSTPTSSATIESNMVAGRSRNTAVWRLLNTAIVMNFPYPTSALAFKLTLMTYTPSWNVSC